MDWSYNELNNTESGTKSNFEPNVPSQLVDDFSDTVKIVTLPCAEDKAQRPIVDVDNIEAALQGEDNTPVLVVAILGEYRSGKSFMMNLMSTYLEKLQQGRCDEWMTSGTPVKGAAWAQSKNSVTHGIWMWRRVYKIKDKNGREMAVLLIDCQGTGDVKYGSSSLDNITSFISLQLSDVLVINLMRQFDIGALTRLKMCTGYADTVCEEDNLFNQLIFLVRDWCHDTQYGKRPETEFADMVLEAEAGEVKQAGRDIMNAFKDVSVYTLPLPGDKIIKASERDILPSSPMISVSEEDMKMSFLVASKELFDGIFLSEYGDLPTALQFISDVKMLQCRLTEISFEMPTLEEGLNEILNGKAYSAAENDLAGKLSEKEPELLENPSDSSENMINEVMNALWKETKALYDEKSHLSKRGESEPYRKYLKLLQKTWNHSHATLIVRAKTELAEQQIEQLQQVIRIYNEERKRRHDAHVMQYKEFEVKINTYKAKDASKSHLVKAWHRYTARFFDTKNETTQEYGRLREEYRRWKETVESEEDEFRQRFGALTDALDKATEKYEREWELLKIRSEENERLKQDHKGLWVLKKAVRGLVGAAGVIIAPLWLPPVLIHDDLFAD